MTRIACIHGLGGTGATMEPLAARLRACGHEVVCPTLPGHGTRPEDLEVVGWDVWLAVIPDAEVLVGQSMGGSLALAAAATRPHGVRAIVCINALAPDPDAVDGLEWRRDRGETWVDSGPAAEGEVVYDRLPMRALLEMATGTAAIDLAAIAVPVLVVNGALDDVVDPGHSDLIAMLVAGPVERVVLPRSGHVAALGPEADELAEAIARFVSSLGS